MIKRIVIVFIFCMLSRTVVSQTVVQGVHDAREQGRLNQIQALYYEALAVHLPELLPEAYRIEGGLPLKSGFDLNYRLKRSWDRFTPEQRNVLEPFLFRPSLPLSHVSQSGRFRIHYTLTGADQVSGDDEDGSGVPDYVEFTAQCMDTVYAVLVEQIGLHQPPDDNGRDGPEWDVYIRDIYGVYGWTNVEERISQNPDIYITYMELDNNYTHTPTKGLDALRVTTAHEFFHMVQLGYIGRDDDNDGSFDDLFLMEAGSTWMEDVVHDDVNDYVYYLTNFFNRTNTPFNTSNGSWEYGLCLWFHFLEARTGGRAIVRETWVRLVSSPAMEALAEALQARGIILDDELTLFWAWNVFTGSRAQPALFYEEGSLYPEVFIDAALQFKQDTTLTTDIRHLSARYFRLFHPTGTVYTLVPTNLDREFDARPDEFTLIVGSGSNRMNYTDLPGGVQVRMIADDILRWKCAAITEMSGFDPDLVTFNATPAGDVTEDLPACYPQPFVIDEYSMTTIPFMLEFTGRAKIVIAQASGHVVREDEQQVVMEGLQFYRWDGRNEHGDHVSSGIYFYTILVEDQLIRQEKIAVVR